MTQHQFLLQPGEWLGKGQVKFSESDEILSFQTLWQVTEKEEKKIVRHTVELVGVPEKVINELEITNINKKGFTITLTNEMVDKVEGKGIIDEKQLSWEFRKEPGFEGFELYRLQEDGSYKVHAEYLSSEQFRTIIDGHIWKRGTST